MSHRRNHQRAQLVAFLATFMWQHHTHQYCVDAFIPATISSSPISGTVAVPIVNTLDQHWYTEQVVPTSSTSLSALRTWNLNRQPGSSPFGLDLNAEVWNGRVAQVAFSWVFIQEWIQDKSVLKGLSDGDFINMISAGVFAVLIAALTVRFLMEPAAGDTSPRMNTPSTTLSGPSKYNHVPSIAKTVRAITNPYEDLSNMFVNFNDGRSPFGLKANAEIWNGRIAMFSFVWVIVQEFVMGEGFITAIEKGDTAALIALGAELVTILGFTVGMSMVASNDDYVEQVVGKEALIMNAKYANQWTPPSIERPYELPPISSVTPGVGVSDPVTYDMYMQERARIEAREKEAKWVSSFSNSLKAMSAADSESTATMSLPFGAAYTPVVVQPRTYTAINYPLPSEADKATVAPSAVTVSVPATTMRVDRAISSSTGSSESPIGLAVRPAFVGQPLKMEDRAMIGRPKPPITFRVDGYRFKPETQSAIASSPHPGGTFTFKSDTSLMIKSSNTPKPVPYPVEGFKFGENTKNFIKATERTDVVAPETTTSWQQQPSASQQQILSPPQPIMTPSYTSTVDVVPSNPSGGVPQPLNAAPAGNAVSRAYRNWGGSSYLDALNSNAGRTSVSPVNIPDAPTSRNSPELVATMSVSSTPSKRGSYLDSL